MRSSPRSEFARRLPHLRALTARALRAMADKVEPVATESLIVRTQAYGYHFDSVFHNGQSATLATKMLLARQRHMHYRAFEENVS